MSVSLGGDMSECPPPKAPRRVVVVQNPISGLPVRQALVPRFLAAARAGGAEVKLVRTEAAGHGTELAAELCASDCDVIVVAGGDGTVNEVLNGMDLTSGTALATFPTGTSSIFARDRGIPFAPETAARAVLAGRRQRMDVSTVNGRRFLMVVGVGWDAHVVSKVVALRDGHLGQHRYVIPVIRATFDYSWPELSVRLPGETDARPAKLVWASNIRNYAAFFRITPDARPDDGRLDFLVIRDGRPRDAVRWMAGALLGTLPRLRETDYVTGRELFVTSDEPVPYQVDGDPGGVTPIHVAMLPDAVEVIVP
jgi:YegS/Rv2252/BmrU family lipid kinase